MCEKVMQNQFLPKMNVEQMEQQLGEHFIANAKTFSLFYNAQPRTKCHHDRWILRHVYRHFQWGEIFIFSKGHIIQRYKYKKSDS